jgi:hypothetical protein
MRAGRDKNVVANFGSQIGRWCRGANGGEPVPYFDEAGAVRSVRMLLAALATLKTSLWNCFFQVPEET